MSFAAHDFEPYIIQRHLGKRVGVERIAQKVIEEAGEAALAGATMNRENLPKELADLLYHTLVLLAASDLSPEDVWRELRERRG